MDPVLRMAGTLEPRSAWEAKRCSIAAALEIVGTRSTLLILREAFYGTRRFDDFAVRVGLSEAVTATRLRELVEQGLLERTPYREPGQRTRHEYRLTEKGADLLPALIALMSWGDRWLTTDGGVVEIRHRNCGARVEPRLDCAAGHNDLTPDQLDLAVTRTPGAAADPATRA